MDNYSGNKEYNIYRDIRNRTNGEIYLGIVGPVRTGKSTFIKRFMELMVLPFMEGEAEKERAMDELPQAAAGKTIMTTEPKFIPQQAAEIRLSDFKTEEEPLKLRVRLIDCVGFLADGAVGHMEGNGSRMVKTPWSDQEIPFAEAASIGTEKVIRDHATIGIVVTTDGTIGELARENYINAEERTVQELKNIGKPLVILLNSAKPYAQETIKLASEMEENYQTTVVPVNCEQLRKDDIVRILENILCEFPVTRVEFFIPKWTEMLKPEHPMKAEIIKTASGILDSMHKTGDVRALSFTPEQYVSQIKIDETDLATGRVVVRMDLDDKYYYENISELTGVPIAGEYELISMIKEMAGQKEAYEKVSDAFEAVQVKGYGVVSPGLSDIKMEEPVLIRHGNKFGVKMKAVSPSIHMIRANIETEIAPIVGNEKQAEDLAGYIKKGSETPEGVWGTNIFGKTIGEIVDEGIINKINNLTAETQSRMQGTIEKITNDQSRGVICIVL